MLPPLAVADVASFVCFCCSCLRYRARHQALSILLRDFTMQDLHHRSRCVLLTQQRKIEQPPTCLAIFLSRHSTSTKRHTSTSQLCSHDTTTIVPQGCLLPSNTPPLVQAQSKAKPKSSRGLDLEEVRRRTSLLSGGGRTSSPAGSGAGGLAATERRSAAHRSSETSSHVSDMRWSRQHESQRSSFSSGVGVGHHLAAQHPLHSEPPPDPLFAGVVDGSGRGGDVFGSTGSYDRRGNYFNEDLLLARAKGNRSASGGEGGSIGFDPLQAAGERRGGQEGGQNAWGGDALRDTAGTFLTSARSGSVIRLLGWVELRMNWRFEGIVSVPV